MIPVEISEAADADLVEILSYGTETFGEAQAEAYVASFDDTFDLISRQLLAGAVHAAVRPPVRSLPHGSHRIFMTSSKGGRWCSVCCTRRWTWRGILKGRRKMYAVPDFPAEFEPRAWQSVVAGLRRRVARRRRAR